MKMRNREYLSNIIAARLLRLRVLRLPDFMPLTYWRNELHERPAWILAAKRCNTVRARALADYGSMVVIADPAAPEHHFIAPCIYALQNKKTRHWRMLTADEIIRGHKFTTVVTIMHDLDAFIQAVKHYYKRIVPMRLALRSSSEDYTIQT